MDPSVFTEKVEKLMATGGQAKGKSAKTAEKSVRAAPKKKSTAASTRKKL